MAKKSKNRPNVTNNTTNIVSVSSTGVGQESFSALLELQQKSVEFQQTISQTLKDSLMYQRTAAVEELIIAREGLEQQRVLNDISKTLKSIAKTLSDIGATALISAGGTASTSNTSSAVNARSKEDKNEAQRSDDEKTNLLKEIAKNTAKKDAAVKPKEEASGLGALLGALAAGLGVIVGALSAQLKAIKYFASLLTPEFILAKISKITASFAAGISMMYDLVKATIGEKLSVALKFVDGIVDSVKGFFTGVVDSIKGLFGAAKEESTIAKIIKAITSGISTVMAPFAEAFTIIKDFVSGPIGKLFETIKGVFTGAIEGTKGFFTTLMETFGKFGSMFKSVAVIAEKLFLPLTIIMTVWDTVKGAIEGFEKEGIVGGIKGAITGFFNSLIFGPMDMLKDATAWVLGFFGFDNAKEVLDSFSLEKMFKDFIDKLFDAPKYIAKKMTEFFEIMKSFEIPGFSFKVPGWVPLIGGKETSFGPWKPFASSNNSSGQTVSSSNVAPSASTSTSATVTSQSSEVGAMKEKTSAPTTIISAPAVNNNMKQTNVAKIDAPVRNNDSSMDRYFSSRAVY